MAVWKDNGVWCFKVTVKDSLGRSRQIKRQDKEWNKRDATRAESEYLNEHGVGASMKFKALAKEYFEHAKVKSKRSSQRTTVSMYSHQIAPYFDDFTIERISNKHILEWQRDLLKKDLKNHYLTCTQSLFRSILNYGVDCNYILKNPFTVDYAKHIGERKETVQVLSIREFEQFLQVVDNPTDHALYMLLFWGGLRIGEALALTIGDLDFESMSVTVSKTYSNIGKVMTTPKTSNSYRSVRLSKPCYDVLMDLIGTYKGYAKLSPERFIFGYDVPMNYTSYHYRHRQYVKRSGLPYFKVHSLRHSCVSVLIALGVKPLQIAKRMGHTVEMVNNTYGHMFPDDEKQIAEMQESLTFSKLSVNSLN